MIVSLNSSIIQGKVAKHTISISFAHAPFKFQIALVLFVQATLVDGVKA